MNLFEKIKAKPQLLIFGVFLLSHLLLININRVEWGDSYRILRAAEHIRDFSYPSDEKRPPLFSAFLALRPCTQLDPVLWGKIFMLLISIASFWVFLLISQRVLKNKKAVITSLLLFTFNPTYFYWSLRIYADVFFALQVLILTLLYLKWRDQLNPKRTAILAFISVLSIITRFEGYLLTLSLGLGLLLSDFENTFFLKDVFQEIFSKNKNLQKIRISNHIKNVFLYGILVLVFLLPYWLWRNPLDSSYFSEPSGRSYDLAMVVRYSLSLFFLFGFTSAFVFLITDCRKVFSFFNKYKFLGIFVFLELILIFAWPAAIPRLFVPIIPLLILPLSQSIYSFFGEKQKYKVYIVLASAGFLGLYLVGQRIFGMQFLVPMFKVVLGIGLVNLLSLIFLYKKQFKVFLLIIVLSMGVWTYAVVYSHKDIYATIRSSLDYSRENLAGVIAYNDTSSASSWYLNDDPNAPNDIEGKYFEYGSSDQLSQENLKNKGYDYLIFTNEHNPSLDVDFKKRPYLEVIKVFREDINGRIFFAKIVKVKN